MRFIVNYERITKGFMWLLKKGVPFVLDEVSQSSFDTLKKSLMTTPILSPPYYIIDFLIYLVASNSNIGVLLV